MNRAWIATLVVTASFSAGTGRTASAQDMSFGLEEAEHAPAEAAGEAAAPTGEGDVIGELAATAQAQAAAAGPAEAVAPAGETSEEIYAVQQIYALRINRLEFAPSFGFTLNDPYMSHTSFGFALNYWFTNVLAAGIDAIWYQGLENESDLNFYVRRSTRLVVPITEYQYGVHLHMSYVPIYGKFAMFNEYIFQWDSYIIGGMGLVMTRPVAVVDPAPRHFDFGARVAFNAGLGIRVFVTRFLSVFSEVRDYMMFEQLENLDVALGEQRADPDTWIEESAAFTNNFTVHLGVTMFFPFTFEYRLPK